MTVWQLFRLISALVTFIIWLRLSHAPIRFAVFIVCVFNVLAVLATVFIPRDIISATDLNLINNLAFIVSLVVISSLVGPRVKV